MQWVKLYDEIEHWEWYDDDTCLRLLLHLLLHANYAPAVWRGVKLDVGEMISSPERIGEKIGRSRQQVRTAQAKLQECGTITIRTTNKFTVYKVNNYDFYQNTAYSQPTNNQQITINQPTNNQQITTAQKKTEENRRKQNKKEASMQADSIPVLADVQEYAAESGGLYDPLEFYKRMENDDWTYNGKPVRNWKKLYDGFSRNAKVKREKEKDISRTWLDALKEI